MDKRRNQKQTGSVQVLTLEPPTGRGDKMMDHQEGGRGRKRKKERKGGREGDGAKEYETG